MGIPCYFSYLVRNYKGVLKKIENVSDVVNNLYLDSNSIVYDCVRELEYIADDNIFQVQLINAVCKKLHEYIDGVGAEKVFIAFDGVAPVAKLEQQRARRYRAWLEREVMGRMKETVDTTWCTAAITPGTKFMSDMAKGVERYFQENACGRTIMVSSSEEPGEGEHKIFDYIRKNPKYHNNTLTVIYGLDADLIMLTLNHLHISERLLLFRETPHFIRHLDKTLDPEKLYCLDIPELACAIQEELTGDGAGEQHDTRRVHDYILLCFLLGNDFMPHFPAVNIRTTGVDHVMAAYRSTIGVEKNKYLTNEDVIVWSNMRRVIAELARNEKTYLESEYSLRKRWEKRSVNACASGETEDIFQSVPVRCRELEKYIALDGSDGFWKERYYRTLFHCDYTEERVKGICLKYLEAMEWTYMYYRKECKDWRWCYPYHFAPLLSDLIKYVPHFHTTMVDAKPMAPIAQLTQLCYVLPRPFHHLLPKRAANILAQRYSKCYRTNWDLQWAFCKYFWECHIEMEPINVEQLENDISS